MTPSAATVQKAADQTAPKFSHHVDASRHHCRAGDIPDGWLGPVLTALVGPVSQLTTHVVRVCLPYPTRASVCSATSALPGPSRWVVVCPGASAEGGRTAFKVGPAEAAASDGAAKLLHKAAVRTVIPRHICAIASCRLSICLQSTAVMSASGGSAAEFTPRVHLQRRPSSGSV